MLRAAGVDCRIESAQPGLESGAQAALGWVVREGATNVLRHAEANCCVIRLTRDAAGATALVMENDGLRPDQGRGGSGLTGLRERLAAVDGTLTGERDETARVFRLRAEIPGVRLPAPAPTAGSPGRPRRSRRSRFLRCRSGAGGGGTGGRGDGTGGRGGGAGGGRARRRRGRRGNRCGERGKPWVRKPRTPARRRRPVGTPSGCCWPTTSI